MSDLTVTLVQADQKWEAVEANLEHYATLLKYIEKTDLIILPEMFQTSFSMNTSLTEPMDGTSMNWLKAMAAKMNAAIYTSLMISEGDHFFNRGIFMRPDGSYEFYDKRKTFGLAKEDQHFTAGNLEKIVTYKNWKIQLQICYDLRFPEIVRNRLDENDTAAYDLIVYVANWPEKRANHWKTLLKARAIENQCYVIGVNRVGSDANELTYSGDSMIIDLMGSELTLPQSRECSGTHVLNKTELIQIRKMLPFLKDR